MAAQVPSLWQVAEGVPVKPLAEVALHGAPTATLSHVASLGQELFAAAGGSPLARQTVQT